MVKSIKNILFIIIVLIQASILNSASSSTKAKSTKKQAQELAIQTQIKLFKKVAQNCLIDHITLANHNSDSFKPTIQKAIECGADINLPCILVSTKKDSDSKIDQDDNSFFGEEDSYIDYTPLGYVLERYPMKNKLACIKSLLELGADPNQPYNSGYPLTVCLNLYGLIKQDENISEPKKLKMLQNYLVIMGYLLKYGAHADRVDSNLYACGQTFLEMIQLPEYKEVLEFYYILQPESYAKESSEQ